MPFPSAEALASEELKILSKMRGTARMNVGWKVAEVLEERLDVRGVAHPRASRDTQHLDEAREDVSEREEERGGCIVGRTTSPSFSMAFSARSRKLPWFSWHPFGLPVVPEV